VCPSASWLIGVHLAQLLIDQILITVIVASTILNLWKKGCHSIWCKAAPSFTISWLSKAGGTSAVWIAFDTLLLPHRPGLLYRPGNVIVQGSVQSLQPTLYKC
jgi:hypothetical protein